MPVDRLSAQLKRYNELRVDSASISRGLIDPCLWRFIAQFRQQRKLLPFDQQLILAQATEELGIDHGLSVVPIPSGGPPVITIDTPIARFSSEQSAMLLQDDFQMLQHLVLFLLSPATPFDESTASLVGEDILKLAMKLAEHDQNLELQMPIGIKIGPGINYKATQVTDSGIFIARTWLPPSDVTHAQNIYYEPTANYASFDMKLMKPNAQNWMRMRASMIMK